MKLNKDKKIKIYKIQAIILLIITIFLLVFIGLLMLRIPKEKFEIESQEKNFYVKNLTNFKNLRNSTIVNLNVPAVDKDGKGVLTTLSVEAIPGTGRTLVDIDNLLFWADTQNSIRIAREVAGSLTNISLEKVDLIYKIYANAAVVGGPSGGAALTIATIAALENKSLNKNVTITGTINHDGSIGPVSDILEKAKISKKFGASLLLVPLLQSREVVYETKEHCRKYGISEFCIEEKIPRKVNVEKEIGIKVKEVGSVKEAMKYFFE